MSKYYIAYGSNLNLNQMKRRCPAAKAVGQAMLKDYKLVFNTHATVVKKVGAQTPVGVFEITDDCEVVLDFYEGYPSYYRKEYIDITINGNVVRAMVYIMNEAGFSLPNKRYFVDIVDGYEDFGFDLEYLTAAIHDTAINCL